MRINHIAKRNSEGINFFYSARNILKWYAYFFFAVLQFSRISFYWQKKNVKNNYIFTYISYLAAYALFTLWYKSQSSGPVIPGTALITIGPTHQIHRTITFISVGGAPLCHSVLDGAILSNLNSFCVNQTFIPKDTLTFQVQFPKRLSIFDRNCFYSLAI